MNAKVCVVLFLALAALPSSAFAYIDPGTGSMALQALLAIAAGVAVALRAYWHRVKALIARFRGQKEAPKE
ncbi:MAG TPA: hypothetical protein VF678_00020 [bacterium]